MCNNNSQKDRREPKTTSHLKNQNVATTAIQDQSGLNPEGLCASERLYDTSILHRRFSKRKNGFTFCHFMAGSKLWAYPYFHQSFLFKNMSSTVLISLLEIYSTIESTISSNPPDNLEPFAKKGIRDHLPARICEH